MVVEEPKKWIEKRVKRRGTAIEMTRERGMTLALFLVLIGGAMEFGVAFGCGDKYGRCFWEVGRECGVIDLE